MFHVLNVDSLKKSKKIKKRKGLIVVSKDRTIADPIDALFRHREEELRALNSEGTLTEPQYQRLSSILSAILGYFVNAAGANEDDSFTKWIDISGPVDPKTEVFGIEALESRKFHIQNRVAAYIAEYGNFTGRIIAAFHMGMSASEMDFTIRNLIMSSVGNDDSLKNPQTPVTTIPARMYNYTDLLA